MISERAKKLVEDLQSWRSLEQAYEIAQKALDEERAEGKDEEAAVWVAASVPYVETVDPWAKAFSVMLDEDKDMLAERIAQTRAHNEES